MPSVSRQSRPGGARERISDLGDVSTKTRQLNYEEENKNVKKNETEYPKPVKQLQKKKMSYV